MKIKWPEYAVALYKSRKIYKRSPFCFVVADKDQHEHFIEKFNDLRKQATEALVREKSISDLLNTNLQFFWENDWEEKYVPNEELEKIESGQLIERQDMKEKLDKLLR